MNETTDLRDDDRQILNALQDSESSFAFQGIKRKLGLHQETLSRALRRLERDQLIEHTEGGYRLTTRGSAMVKGARGRAQSYKILETYLPSDVWTSNLISRLKYSWFSSLRWLGYAHRKEGAVLTWLSDDGSLQMRAIFQGKRLTIETDSNDEEAFAMAVKFAYELVSRITKEYQPARVESSEFN